MGTTATCKSGAVTLIEFISQEGAKIRAHFGGLHEAGRLPITAPGASGLLALLFRLLHLQVREFFVHLLDFLVDRLFQNLEVRLHGRQLPDHLTHYRVHLVNGHGKGLQTFLRVADAAAHAADAADTCVEICVDRSIDVLEDAAAAAAACIGLDTTRLLLR